MGEDSSEEGGREFAQLFDTHIVESRAIGRNFMPKKLQEIRNDYEFTPIPFNHMLTSNFMSVAVTLGKPVERGGGCSVQPLSPLILDSCWHILIDQLPTLMFVVQFSFDP